MFPYTVNDAVAFFSGAWTELSKGSIVLLNVQCSGLRVSCLDRLTFGHDLGFGVGLLSFSVNNLAYGDSGKSPFIY